MRRTSEPLENEAFLLRSIDKAEIRYTQGSPGKCGNNVVLMIVLRILATILSGPMLLIGIIWVLQGLNILPGSFMTGQIIWAIYGAPLALAGGGLVWWVSRRR